MDPTKQPFSTYEPPSYAPPPYTSPQVWGSPPPRPSEKPPPTSNNLTYRPTTTTTSYPTQPPPSPPLLLHIYSTSLLSSNLTILAPDKQTTAYTIHANSASLFSSKPHIKIYRGAATRHPTTPPIGTATFHSTTRSIDLTLGHNGRPVTLSHHGLFTSKYEFPSTIGVLRWKSAGGFGGNLVCETVVGGQWVARFEATSFAVEKRGKFEIGGLGLGEEGVDEIVVSGLAVVEQVRSQRRQRSAGAGAGAAAGSC